MNKNIYNFGISLLMLCVAINVEANCGRQRRVNNGGDGNMIRIGGCCRRYTSSFCSENAPWKVVPEDIQLLPDSSIFKKKYVKAFDLVPKTVKSWIRQSYTKRITFLNSEMWLANRAKLEQALARNKRIDREGYITRKDVLEMAEQMLIYGRALKFGGMADGNIREIAERYGFKRVSAFLKDTMDFKRYKRRGCDKVYPKNDPEFANFDKMMTEWHSAEWSEYRARLCELNKKYQRNI